MRHTSCGWDSFARPADGLAPASGAGATPAQRTVGSFERRPETMSRIDRRYVGGTVGFGVAAVWVISGPLSALGCVLAGCAGFVLSQGLNGSALRKPACPPRQGFDAGRRTRDGHVPTGALASRRTRPRTCCGGARRRSDLRLLTRPEHQYSPCRRRDMRGCQPRRSIVVARRRRRNETRARLRDTCCNTAIIELTFRATHDCASCSSRVPTRTERAGVS